MSDIKIALLILMLMILGSFDSKCQDKTDSLVIFSDLKFHSEFEKNAFVNFLAYHKDTFMMFLAIDENMTEIQAKQNYTRYQSVFELINQKRLTKTETEKNIKKIFKLVHEKFLFNYRNISHFPAIFTRGNYNCVSASMLYALIFKELGIAFKIFQTPTHTYLVANPGSESLIIETTNPNLSAAYFSQEFKEDYLQKLKSVKMAIQNEQLNKSVDELFYEKYYNGKEADFANLLGFDYLNKSISKIQDNKQIDSYELLQKAYFFFPDQQVYRLLYSALIQRIENSKFNQVSDIDYLVHLARYDNIDIERLTNIYTQIIQYNLQYTDRAEFCDSLYTRMIGNITNKDLIKEIGFAHHLYLSKYFQNSEKILNYIEKAIELKQNHVEANNLFVEYLEKRLDRISGFNIINDSIDFLKKKYNYKFLESLFADYRLIAYLNQSYNFFSYSKIAEGESYLVQFENLCPHPLSPDRKKLVRAIESTYRTLALHYYYKGEHEKVMQTINRGLKFVPGSRYIQTALY